MSSKLVFIEFDNAEVNSIVEVFGVGKIENYFPEFCYKAQYQSLRKMCPLLNTKCVIIISREDKSYIPQLIKNKQ